MNCTDIQDKLSPYVDGELPDGERGEVEVHLESCGECRQTLEGLRAQHSELDTAFQPLREKAEASADKIIAALPAAGPKRFGPRWLPIVFAAAAGFLVAFLIFGLQPPPEPVTPPGNPDARLVASTGPVEFREGDRWTALPTGGGVNWGTEIRTGENAKCSFVCPDGTEVRVNRATELAFESPRRLSLMKGRIFTTIVPQSISYVVKTDQAEIEALGTTLDISHGGSKKLVTTLTVVEGRARMADKTIGQGFRCKVIDGAIQDPKRAYDLAMMTSWVNEILALRGEDEEFNRRVNKMLAKLGATKMDFLVESEIRALGDHCSLPLTRFIQSEESMENTRRRLKAAQILADVCGAPSVPDLVGLLQDKDVKIRVEMARGLKRLTGQSFGQNENAWSGSSWQTGCDSWNSWLDKNRDTWGGRPVKKN